MIELHMVQRMVRRALFVSPVVIGALALVGSVEWAVSAAAGLALTLLNLWLAARIIGRFAERKPHLLVGGAMAAFGLGLAALTAIALLLQASDLVYFPVTGFVLIGSHFVLVLWEAAGAYDALPRPSDRAPLETRS